MHHVVLANLDSSRWTDGDICKALAEVSQDAVLYVFTQPKDVARTLREVPRWVFMADGDNAWQFQDVAFSWAQRAAGNAKFREDILRQVGGCAPCARRGMEDYLHHGWAIQGKAGDVPHPNGAFVLRFWRGTPPTPATALAPAVSSLVVAEQEGEALQEVAARVARMYPQESRLALGFPTLGKDWEVPLA